jgi:4-amino-4-deoxy-L-arabinose transferase-like glycosyltransferase
MLAPIFVFFGENIWLMRFLIVACAVASVGTSYLLIRRFASASVALAVGVMTAASYALFFEATLILSDIPYMLVSLLALYYGERYRHHLTWWNAGVVIALAIAAYLIRIIGFTLPIAIAGAILINKDADALPKRFLHAVVLVAAMALVVAAWMGRSALVSHQPPPEFRESLSYEDELLSSKPRDPQAPMARMEEVIRRVILNAAYYERLFASLLSGQVATSGFPMHLLSCLWIVGWGIAATCRRSSLEWYTLGYLCIYLLWPSRQGERFLVPILPMVYYYPLQTVLWLFEQTKRQTVGLSVLKAPAMLSIGFLVAFLNVRQHAALAWYEGKVPYYSRKAPEYLGAIRWIRDNTPKTAVVITDRAPYVWLLTERKAYSGPWIEDNLEVLKSWTRNRVTHVITNDLRYAKLYINPVVQAYRDRFREVHRIGQSTIYERRTDQ